MEQLKAPKGANKKKRIVGRGSSSGVGRSAGRGHDGQNSRSGGGVRLGFEGGQMPLYRRIAARGFSNMPFKKVDTVINLAAIEKKYQDGEEVNRESLLAKGIIKKKGVSIKILGDGELTKKLTFSIEKISAGARKKIEAVGGEIKEQEGNNGK